jgi:hypothetical protein
MPLIVATHLQTTAAKHSYETTLWRFNMQNAISNTPPPPQPKPFAFRVIKPYSLDPAAANIPFLIEGLFKRGGLSSLVAKPKQGKSSLSRFAAVCVSKGKPFLGRKTVKGEVLLISIEDPTSHTNSCLKVLGYDDSPGSEDAAIHLIDRVAYTGSENIAALRKTLTDYPDIRLIVIDTLAKFVRVKKVEDYNLWLSAFEMFRQLLRDFPLVSILCLLHAKKVTEDDPFDSMLGSSALRGEFDTNAAIYKEGKGSTRFFLTESRIGKVIHPCVLLSETEDAGDANIVRTFSLGQSVSELESEKQHSSERKRKQTVHERVITYLSHCPNDSAVYKYLLEDVEGKSESIVEAVTELVADGTIAASGLKGSPMNPYTLKLNRNALPMLGFLTNFGGVAQ